MRRAAGRALWQAHSVERSHKSGGGQLPPQKGSLHEPSIDAGPLDRARPAAAPPLLRGSTTTPAPWWICRGGAAPRPTARGRGAEHRSMARAGCPSEVAAAHHLIYVDALDAVRLPKALCQPAARRTSSGLRTRSSRRGLMAAERFAGLSEKRPVFFPWSPPRIHRALHRARTCLQR